jgi:hypothetical protein
MTSTPLKFWSVWLQVAAGMLMLLSAVLLLAPSLGLAIFSTVYFLQPEFPVATPAAVVTYIRFMHGVLGAVMLGWMVAVLALARGPFVQGERSAWHAIAVSASVWFLIDTGYSLWHGVWGNVALNLATITMFAVPLIGSRKHFV